MPAIGTPVYDKAQILEAYRNHRINFGGSDRDFLSSKAVEPMPSEAWLRHTLRDWRARASQGLDPLTGLPSDTALTLSQQLGEPDALRQANASKQAAKQAQDLQDKANAQAALQQPTTTDARAAELQLLTPEQRRVRKAERIMDKVLSGRPVPPAQHKMAVSVLENAGKLGKAKVDARAGKVSEFTTWPNAGLVELLTELGAQALATRHDPAPPAVVVPAEERDAARLDEASAQPLTLEASLSTAQS